MRLSSNQYQGWRLISRRKKGNFIYFNFEYILRNVLIRQKKRHRYSRITPRILRPVIVRILIRYSLSRKIFKFSSIFVKGHPTEQWHYHFHFYPRATWLCWGNGEYLRILEDKSLFQVLNSHLFVLIGILADYQRGSYQTLEAMKKMWTIPVRKGMGEEEFSELEKIQPLPNSFWR